MLQDRSLSRRRQCRLARGCLRPHPLQVTMVRLLRNLPTLPTQHVRIRSVVTAPTWYAPCLEYAMERTKMPRTLQLLAK